MGSCTHGRRSNDCSYCQRLERTNAAKIELLKILNHTEIHEGENSDEIEQTRNELRKTFEHFPELIESFVSIYLRALSGKGIDVGDIKIFMVGGRVLGRPLKANSDIDLVWVFEKPFSTNDPEKKLEWIELRKKVLFEDFPRSCQQYGIQNVEQYPGRFQFFNWGGEKTLEELQRDLQENEKMLRVY